MKKIILPLCTMTALCLIINIAFILSEKENKPHSEPFAATLTPQDKLPYPDETKPLSGENSPKSGSKTTLKTAHPVDGESKTAPSGIINIAPTNPTEKSQATNTSAETTQAATKPNETAQPKVSAPKMGDRRTMDGVNQVYILGFGWIKDEGGGGCGKVADGEGDINKMVGNMGGGTYAADMYENGNKIGSMGGEALASQKQAAPHVPTPGEILTELIPTPTKDSTSPDYKPDIPVPENPRQSQLDPEHGDWDKIIGH